MFVLELDGYNYIIERYSYEYKPKKLLGGNCFIGKPLHSDKLYLFQYRNNEPTIVDSAEFSTDKDFKKSMRKLIEKI